MGRSGLIRVELALAVPSGSALMMAISTIRSCSTDVPVASTSRRLEFCVDESAQQSHAVAGTGKPGGVMGKCETLFAAVVLAVGVAPSSALADPIQFTFTYEASPPACPGCLYYPSFSFSFVTPSFVTTAGMFQLAEPVTIGTNPITHAGTNDWGVWIFGNGVGESISDVGYELTFDTLAFAFGLPTPGFIDHLGTFAGQVQGQTSYLTPPVLPVSGTGTLDLSPVPEPGTLILVGTGALVASRCRRRRQRSHT
jgi:hypothetical protein